MDKTKLPKGVIKVITHENQVLHHYHSADKDKHFFQVEENDFPSLSEVNDKNPKSEKESSACSASSFTYSSKLKTLLAECSSENKKFENVRHNEPKVKSVSSQGLSRNKSPLSQDGSDRHMVKSSQSEQQIRPNLTKQSTSVYNVVHSANKKSTDSKFNSSFSEGRSKKSESFTGNTNMKIPYGQKSVTDNQSTKATRGESSTFVRYGHSPKGHNLHAGEFTNIQNPSFSKSLSNPRSTNAAYSSFSKSDWSYKKENGRPNISAQNKRQNEANRIFISKAENGQSVRLSQVNALQSNVSGNSSKKGREHGNSGSQMTSNFAKTENNGTRNQPLYAQSSLPGPNETKKKKKRKSKLKRQAALQTGKILFLTPEVHSKIVSQSNNVCVQRHQNVLTNINDDEEYPELGLAEPKTVKKNHSAVTNMHIKEEKNPNNFVAFGSETDKKENILVSKNTSANDNFEAAKESDEKKKAALEKSEGEKSTIHSTNPITLSLFDMLVTAKPRKKEPEKKDESTENNPSSKVFKREMIKKNIPQTVNPFASSKLTIKRGKEREKPKVKRPSRMRKLILLERQLRKENMAVKKHESEDENQEKSEEILPEIHLSHDVNDFSTHDNLETCDENLLNYVIDTNYDTDTEDSETYEIFDDVNSKTLKQFGQDCDDSNFLAGSKFHDIMEKSKLLDELLYVTNQTIEKSIIGVTRITNNFNNMSDSVVDIQHELVSNRASNLTDDEKHFVEDLTDINTYEGVTEICSPRNVREKYSDKKNSISYAGCINENLMENDQKTENSCGDYKFINKALESNCKATDLNENMPTIADFDINSKNGASSEERDSTKAEQSNRILDSSEKVSNISANSFSDQEKVKTTKLLFHSRKFRPYCNHFISKEIDEAVFSLIDDLARFQDRMYQKDPVKAKIKRRLVYGIKEIKKHMKLKKVKCIIIATDIEDIKIEGGLNDSLGELISLAEAYHIPCVFSHRRFNLGKVCRKSVPVSCVGIFNYEGSEKNFKKMIELHDDSKHDYLEVTKKLASELTNDQVKELFEAEKESILFVREVSQKILREKVCFTPEEYRINETPDLLEKSVYIKSEDSIAASPQQSEDSNLHMSIEKSLSFIKDLKINETDINTILVKYKVVKEC